MEEERVRASEVIEQLEIQMNELQTLIDSMDTAICKMLSSNFIKSDGCHQCCGRAWYLAGDNNYDNCTLNGCCDESRERTGVNPAVLDSRFDRDEYRLTVEPLFKLQQLLRNEIFELKKPPRKGDEVIVVKGRKAPIGFTGKIIWVGAQMGDGVPRHVKQPWRVGIKNPFIAEVQWTSIDNIEKLL